MQRIGIMQGRLLPPEVGRLQCFPRRNWSAEFALASAAGLDSIEWIYDIWGTDANPISSDDGIDRIKALATQHGIAVPSICADYFVEQPLVRCDLEEKDRRTQRLVWLISRCEKAGISRIVLPFVDNSNISSESEVCEVIDRLSKILPLAASSGVEIHLETSLGPATFAKLLDKLPFPNARVNYDTGNSASLGYDVREEFSAYGDRIGSVHIKDRLQGGGTVPLGSGGADFTVVFDNLRRISYRGDFTLQVARSTNGDEVNWARHNADFVRGFWPDLRA